MAEDLTQSGVFALTLFTKDLTASKAFYSTLLNAEPIWGDAVSSVFKTGDTMINLLQNAAVPDLIAPAEMAALGLRAVYTLRVADVDETCARLIARGLRLLNGPMDRPWGIRTAALQDPSGHCWELACDLPQP